MHQNRPKIEPSKSVRSTSPMQAASNDPPPSIDIHYAFLHSSVTTKESKGYEDSHIHIISDGTRPFADGRVPCTAEFEWREFMADFNCHYHPSTATFADFAVVEDSMEGGMEEVVKKITIEMHQEKDDNRNLFLVVRMDFGYSACSSIQGILFGKKVLEGKEVGKCVAKWDCLYDPKGKTFGAWKTIPTSVKGWGPRLTKIVPSFMRNKTVEGAQSDKGKGKEGGYLATKEMVVSSGSAPHKGRLYGKAMLPGQKASDVQLTEDEKRRLRVMLWEDGFRDQSAEKTQAKRMSTALDSILSMRLDDEDED